MEQAGFTSMVGEPCLRVLNSNEVVSLGSIYYINPTNSDRGKHISSVIYDQPQTPQYDPILVLSDPMSLVYH